MPSLLGLTTLTTASPSKEEWAQKRPRGEELAERQAATDEGPVQLPHGGHQVAAQPAVQTPQEAVHGAGSGAQHSAAIFEAEADGEDLDESQIYAVSAVTTVAPRLTVARAH